MIKTVQNLDSKVICKMEIIVPLHRVVVIIDYMESTWRNVWRILNAQEKYISDDNHDNNSNIIIVRNRCSHLGKKRKEKE